MSIYIGDTPSYKDLFALIFRADSDIGLVIEPLLLLWISISMTTLMCLFGALSRNVLINLFIVCNSIEIALHVSMFCDLRIF